MEKILSDRDRKILWEIIGEIQTKVWLIKGFFQNPMYMDAEMLNKLDSMCADIINHFANIPGDVRANLKNVVKGKLNNG